MKKTFAGVLCVLALLGGGLSTELLWASDGGWQEVLTRFVRDQIPSVPGRLTVTAGEVARSRASCPAPEVFLPPGGHLLGQGTLGIRCPAPSDGAAPWVLYVPVYVHLKTTLVVASRPLSPEHVLEEQDLVEQQGEAQRPDVVTRMSDAVGKVLKQGVASGQALHLSMLRPVFVVHKGQTVPVVVEGHGFKISTEGQAMNDAVSGDTVQVRTASGRLVTGIAGNDGQVEVSP